MKQLITKHNYPLFPEARSSDEVDFVGDVMSLLERQQQGHMECWEYGGPQYLNDLAGGGHFWARLIHDPKQYYLSVFEKPLIKKVVDFASERILHDIQTVIELGPGSNDSLRDKTIPFVNSITKANTYIAIDYEEAQAENAVRYIQDSTSLKRCLFFHDKFIDFDLNTPRPSASALVMWGGTIGNIAGSIGDNPYSSLLQSLTHYCETIATGDFVFITFDTQEDETAILNAYNQPLLSACFLSTLHRLVRDDLVSGEFDPHQWRHESVWIADMMQCAHTIYPTADQNFVLNGVEFNIPANQRFVTNNSYKFKSEVMMAAAHEAGFDPRVIQHGPMAMLIAEKR